MQALAPDHLHQTDNGWEVVLHRMIKTPQPVFLPIWQLFGGKPQRILLKYLDETSPVIFPGISNQKGNEYLKTLAGMAGVNIPLTWHMGRHTFGSQLAARTNDPYLIMKLMGHQEIKTSMIYIHSSEATIRRKVGSIHW